MKKQTLAFLTAILLINAFVVSCSSENTSGNGAAVTSTVSENNSVSSESISETEELLTDSLPDGLNLNGETVAFYSNCYYDKFSPNFVEEINGEVLNDARYEAESSVETRLNVSIEETLGSANVEEFDKTLRALVAAADTTYDIASNMDRFMIADSMLGYFIPTSDLEYVNLGAEYWNSEATGRFSIGGKIYYTLTSFNLYSYKNTNCLFMNLDYADSLSIAPPYEVVRNGGWTYEKMTEIASQGYNDINGDGKADEGDMYGYTSENIYNIWINAVVGSGCCDEIMHKDDNDDFVYGVSEKLYNVLDYIYNFYNDSPYLNKTSIKREASNFMFCEARLDLTESLREADFEYTILPIPKYSEEQENYYCRTYDTYFTMTLASTTRPESCGAVLEAYSCEAYNKILPAYIEDTLKNKYSRDDDTTQMVEIIVNRRTVSLAEAFMYSLYGNDQFHLAFMDKNSMTAASVLDSLKNTTIDNIEKYNEYFSQQ